LGREIERAREERDFPNMRLSGQINIHERHTMSPDTNTNQPTKTYTTCMRVSGTENRSPRGLGVGGRKKPTGGGMHHDYAKK